MGRPKIPLKLQDLQDRRICSDNPLQTLAQQQPGAQVRANVPSQLGCVSPARLGSAAGVGWGHLHSCSCVSPAPCQVLTAMGPHATTLCFIYLHLPARKDGPRITLKNHGSMQRHQLNAACHYLCHHGGQQNTSAEEQCFTCFQSSTSSSYVFYLRKLSPRVLKWHDRSHCTVFLAQN